MQQAKISLTESQAKFLNDFEALGYPDKSALARQAIEQFMRQVTQQQLAESADLYAEMYAQDSELRSLTERAIEGWPSPR